MCQQLVVRRDVIIQIAKVNVKVMYEIVCFKVEPLLKVNQDNYFGSRGVHNRKVQRG